MMNLLAKGQVKKNEIVSKIKGAMKSKRGEGYVDTGVKVLIAVVLGALLLAGLYAVFNETILPTMQQKITDMFNYRG